MMQDFLDWVMNYRDNPERWPPLAAKKSIPLYTSAKELPFFQDLAATLRASDQWRTVGAGNGSAELRQEIAASVSSFTSTELLKARPPLYPRRARAGNNDLENFNIVPILLIEAMWLQGLQDDLVNATRLLAYTALTPFSEMSSRPVTDEEVAEIRRRKPSWPVARAAFKRALEVARAAQEYIHMDLCDVGSHHEFCTSASAERRAAEDPTSEEAQVRATSCRAETHDLLWVTNHTCFLPGDSGWVGPAGGQSHTAALVAWQYPVWNPARADITCRLSSYSRQTLVEHVPHRLIPCPSVCADTHEWNTTALQCELRLLRAGDRLAPVSATGGAIPFFMPFLVGALLAFMVVVTTRRTWQLKGEHFIYSSIRESGGAGRTTAVTTLRHGDRAPAAAAREKALRSRQEVRHNEAYLYFRCLMGLGWALIQWMVYATAAHAVDFTPLPVLDRSGAGGEGGGGGGGGGGVPRTISVTGRVEGASMSVESLCWPIATAVPFLLVALLFEAQNPRLLQEITDRFLEKRRRQAGRASSLSTTTGTTTTSLASRTAPTTATTAVPPSPAPPNPSPQQHQRLLQPRRPQHHPRWGGVGGCVRWLERASEAAGFPLRAHRNRLWWPALILLGGCMALAPYLVLAGNCSLPVRAHTPELTIVLLTLLNTVCLEATFLLLVWFPSQWSILLSGLLPLLLLGNVQITLDWTAFSYTPAAQTCTSLSYSAFLNACLAVAASALALALALQTATATQAEDLSKNLITHFQAVTVIVLRRLRLQTLLLSLGHLCGSLLPTVLTMNGGGNDAVFGGGKHEAIIPEEVLRAMIKSDGWPLQNTELGPLGVAFRCVGSGGGGGSGRDRGRSGTGAAASREGGVYRLAPPVVGSGRPLLRPAGPDFYNGCNDNMKKLRRLLQFPAFHGVFMSFCHPGRNAESGAFLIAAHYIRPRLETDEQLCAFTYMMRDNWIAPGGATPVNLPDGMAKTVMEAVTRSPKDAGVFDPAAYEVTGMVVTNIFPQIKPPKNLVPPPEPPQKRDGDEKKDTGPSHLDTVWHYLSCFIVDDFGGGDEGGEADVDDTDYNLDAVDVGGEEEGAGQPRKSPVLLSAQLPVALSPLNQHPLSPMATITLPGECDSVDNNTEVEQIALPAPSDRIPPSP